MRGVYRSPLGGGQLSRHSKPLLTCSVLQESIKLQDVLRFAQVQGLELIDLYNS
jgi:hypothetical protein